MPPKCYIYLFLNHLAATLNLPLHFPLRFCVHRAQRFPLLCQSGDNLLHLTVTASAVGSSLRLPVEAQQLVGAHLRHSQLLEGVGREGSEYIDGAVLAGTRVEGVAHLQQHKDCRSLKFLTSRRAAL